MNIPNPVLPISLPDQSLLPPCDSHPQHLYPLIFCQYHQRPWGLGITDRMNLKLNLKGQKLSGYVKGLDKQTYGTLVQERWPYPQGDKEIITV
jgi:hypothetical protein